MTLMDAFLLGMLAGAVGSGDGGSGTDSNAVHYSADSNKTDAQRAAALDNVKGEPKKLIVNVTYSGGVYSADKTLAEIDAAHSAGKIVIAKYLYHEYYLQLSSPAYAWFTGVNENYKIIIIRVVTAGGVDTWQYREYDVELLPATVTDLESSSITLSSAADNTIYEYGELSALTVTAIDASGDFIIRFTSGATATTTNFPANMKFPTADNLFPACSANTRYEINCSNGYAAWLEWPVLSS